MAKRAVMEFLRSIAYDDYIMEQLVRYAGERVQFAGRVMNPAS